MIDFTAGYVLHASHIFIYLAAMDYRSAQSPG